MPNRVIAIGDIHGCSIALRTLLGAIKPQLDDAIVVLGDVIDWGPDSRDCVQQLIDLSGRCQFILIRGNHEEMLFAALDTQSELRYWLNFGGEETLKSYPYRGGDEFIDRDHVRFLKSQARDYYETDEFIFVHASYDPNKQMAEQSNTTLQWEPVQPACMRRHYSGKPVIAGHTLQTSGEVLDLGFLKVIDTDCNRGGWLTALEIRTRKLIQANQGGEMRYANLIIGADTSNLMIADEQAPDIGQTPAMTTVIETEKCPEVTIRETESSQEIVTEMGRT